MINSVLAEFEAFQRLCIYVRNWGIIPYLPVARQVQPTYHGQTY